MHCPTFTLTLPSELRMLSVARSFIEAVCQTLQIERSAQHALVLVTGEAVSNIVRHAHRDLPDAAIEIRFELCPDRAILTIADQGRPFDIATVPHLNPGELRIGGRGVYMMRALMDEVTCEPCVEGRWGNTLRMVKRGAAAAVPPLKNVG